MINEACLASAGVAAIPVIDTLRVDLVAVVCPISTRVPYRTAHSSRESGRRGGGVLEAGPAPTRVGVVGEVVDADGPVGLVTVVLGGVGALGEV